MNTIYDELKSRNIIKQITFEQDFKELVEKEKISIYLGIDPTADSIHIGHFIPLMLMSYFQKHGHRPILLMGGGTALIGDPSGKTDMRKMLTKEIVEENIKAIKLQVSKFVSFEGDNAAIIVNNADWILNLNYMNFIREYGIYFNVNQMLNAECFKMRMEKGLTFFELNYMLMQSYDFLHLFETEKCKLQIGGDDQWSNMLAGVDLIRKVHKGDSYCLTCPLLLSSEGVKMGKTINGALWLDAKKTSPYEFYQYWRNVDDSSVNQILRMLTFLPMDEVNKLSNLEGERVNEAKKIAAYEITKLIHGEEEAIKAKQISEELFEKNQDAENMPTKNISKELFINNEICILDVLVGTELTKSKNEAKILISQGGISVDDTKVSDINAKLNIADFNKGYIVVKKGKKIFLKIVVI